MLKQYLKFDTIRLCVAPQMRFTGHHTNPFKASSGALGTDTLSGTGIWVFVALYVGLPVDTVEVEKNMECFQYQTGKWGYLQISASNLSPLL